MRGCPSAVCSSRLIFSSSPASQLANDGEANRLFKVMANSIRSRAGKNVSKSMTPTRSKGGVCIWPIN